MRWEKEIRYWSKHPDRTKVWVKFDHNGWNTDNFPCWMPTSMYIVDDEWAELRKANADGEDIYFKRDGEYIKQAEDWWVNEFYDAVHYSHPDEYEINVEPEKKEWYERIPDEGVLCWVWDNVPAEKTPMIIKGFLKDDEFNEYKFVGANETRWKHAEPIKPEECWQRRM